MLRAFRKSDLTPLMTIWLQANQSAHAFLGDKYWLEHFGFVREALPCAEVYVYEDDSGGAPLAFLGMNGQYIEGLFVREGFRSQGLGKKLLDHAKRLRRKLVLRAYEKNPRAVRFYQREGFGVHSAEIEEHTGEHVFTMIWER